MQPSISSKTIPARDKRPGHDSKEAKTLPSGQNKELKVPHPRDVKLGNFTNVSLNSDTI